MMVGNVMNGKVWKKKKKKKESMNCLRLWLNKGHSPNIRMIPHSCSYCSGAYQYKQILIAKIGQYTF